MQKVNDRIPVKRNGFAKEILNKHKKGKNDNNLALTFISNQKINLFLNVLGELCRFNDTIPQYACMEGNA